MKYLYFDETMYRYKFFHSYDEMIAGLKDDAPLGQKDEHYYFELPDKFEVHAGHIADAGDSTVGLLEELGYEIKRLPDELFD